MFVYCIIKFSCYVFIFEVVSLLTVVVASACTAKRQLWILQPGQVNKGKSRKFPTNEWVSLKPRSMRRLHSIIYWFFCLIAQVSVHCEIMLIFDIVFLIFIFIKNCLPPRLFLVTVTADTLKNGPKSCKVVYSNVRESAPPLEKLCGEAHVTKRNSTPPTPMSQRDARHSACKL